MCSSIVPIVKTRIAAVSAVCFGCLRRRPPQSKFLRSGRSNYGFTLLEVLLALSILAIMGTMIFGSFRSLVDATTRAEKAMDELHLVETLANRISDSLRAAAWVDSDPEAYEFRHEAGVGSPPRDTISWVTSRPPFSAQEIEGLIRVELTIEEVDGEDALMMRTVSSLWDEEAPEVEDTEFVEITQRIQGLKVWAYDAQEQDWVEEWERERQLPLSVAVVLTLTPEEPGARAREIIRQIDLPLANLSRATQRGRRRVPEAAEPGQQSGSPARRIIRRNPE